MTRTNLYRFSVFAGVAVLGVGLIGCTSSGDATSARGLSQAELAAAEAGIDQVERIWNRAGVAPIDANIRPDAELEFFVAIDPTDPIIGVVRSAVDEPARETDAFRWVPMVDAANFRRIGREVPSPKINLPPYESRSSGLVVSRYMDVYYLLVHNTGSKRVCSGFAPGFAVAHADVSFDRYSRPTVNFTLNEEGQAALHRLSSEHRGAAIAAVVDGWVISSPRVSGPVTSGTLTTGTMTFTQAEELAARLNAGADSGGSGATVTSVPVRVD